MSVTDVRRHPDGATASMNDKGQREYTSKYLATTDDALDQAEELLSYFMFSGATPRLGSPFAFGNDVDFGSFCNRINPRKVPGHSFLWEVELHFGPLPDRQRTEDDEPTTDPLQYRDQIDANWVTVSRPVEEAKYIRGMKGDADTLKAAATSEFGTTPVTNSAGAIYDPPLEREDAMLSVRITKNKSSFPASQSKTFTNAVNRSAFTINKPKYGFVLGVPAYACRCLGITGSFQFENDVSFWAVVYDLLIDFEIGWHAYVLDRGFTAKAAAGDPDGMGGTISSSALADGVPSQRRLLDPLGDPTAEPVLLDGYGQPIKADSPNQEPIYIEYQIYLKELSFSALQL